ncbi:uncharacterized protein LOC132745914 [Ruditapes philippinarum]|uniref:uncharacterized protein LOC132745914 n=1 Tax=Ruditapes philippinarum TaxID=129788 RepID=UPI00295C0650|nr:uncharacterized protein LOC132745914 [Ruditapes philippinarum]
MASSTSTYHYDSSGDDPGMSSENIEISINLLHRKESSFQDCLYSSVDYLGLSSENDFIDEHSSSVLQPMETIYQDFFTRDEPGISDIAEENLLNIDEQTAYCSSGDEPGMSTDLTDDAHIDQLMMTPDQGPMHAAKVQVNTNLDKHIAGKLLEMSMDINENL